MAVTYVQETGQLTETKHKLLVLRIRQIRLDVIIRAKGSPTSHPSSDSYQHQSVDNPELCFSIFDRLWQSKKIVDSLFRVLEWCWGIFGGITRQTGDA